MTNLEACRRALSALNDALDRIEVQGKYLHPEALLTIKDAILAEFKCEIPEEDPT